MKRLKFETLATLWYRNMTIVVTRITEVPMTPDDLN